MANDMNFQFKISANFAEVKAAFTQMKTDFKQTANDLKQIGQNIKIKVSLDVAGLNTDIQNVKRTIQTQLQQGATQKIKVKIEADAAAIRADLAAIKPQIQTAVASMSGLRIKIPVVADVTALRTQLAALGSQLSGGLLQPINLKMGVDIPYLRAQLIAALHMVRAAIQAMGSLASSVNLNVNLSGAVGGLLTAINDLKAEVIRLRLAMRSSGGGGRGGSGGAGGAGGINSLTGALGSARSALMQFAGALGSLYGLHLFVGITDEAKRLESQIALVSASQQEANNVMASLREISKNNLQSLESSVELYSKLSSATKNLDGSSVGLNTRLTDIVSKLVTISGSSGPAAQGAIIQFGQALSGNFSAAGQELNSIIEQAPALADAIAKSYGVTRGELKKLGAEGKITTVGVINGLIKQGEEVDTQFGKINKTIGGTATTTWDAFKKLITDMDKAIGLSKSMISVLVILRDNINGIVLSVKLLGAALLVALGPAVLSVIARLITQLIAATLAATRLSVAVGGVQASFMLLASFLAGWSIGNYFKKEFLEVELAGIALANGIHTTLRKLQGGFEVLGESLMFAFNNPIETTKTALFVLVALIADVVRNIPMVGESLANAMMFAAEKIAPDGEAGAKFTAAIAKIREKTKNEVDGIKSEYGALADAAIAAKAPTPKPKIGDVKNKNNNKDKKTDKNALKSAQDKLAAEKSLLQTKLDLLESEYQAGTVKMRKYYADKAVLIGKMHDLEINSLNAQAAKASGLDKESLTKQLEAAKAAKSAALTINQNDARKDIEDATRKQFALTENLKNELFAARNEKFTTQLRELEQAAQKSKQEFRDTGADESAIQANDTVVDQLLNANKARLNLDMIEDEIDKFTAKQNGKLKQIDVLKTSGLLGNEDAERRTEAVNESTASRLALYQAELQKMVQKGIPEAQAALTALEQQMLGMPVKAQTNFEVFWQNTNQHLKEAGKEALQSGLSQFFMDVASGAKSGSDAVRSFAQGFAQSMAKVAAEALAAWAVMKLVGFATGSAGAGKGKPTGGVEARSRVSHTGGVMGAVGGTHRQVNMAAFMAAPRYHVGGIAGFKPGEIPAVLMKGEEVLTKNDPRHVANGGKQGQGGGVRIINNIDPNLMQDYLNSSSGEQVIVNLIERNAGTVKQLLR